MDISKETTLLTELINVHEVQTQVELSVVIALLKVPYSWRIIGRAAQEDRMVIVEVGMIGAATWMTLVGMLA